MHHVNDDIDMMNPDVLQESELDQGMTKNSREHNEPQILNFNPSMPTTMAQMSQEQLNVSIVNSEDANGSIGRSCNRYKRNRDSYGRRTHS